MCLPAAALAIASTAISAAGTITSAIGSSQQAKYEAQIAQRNVALDRKASEDALARGQIEEQRQYRKNAQLLGAQRAAAAANGVEVDFGSMADLQTDSKTIGWQDANTVRQNALREAQGYDINAYNDQAKANSAKAASTNALIKGAFDLGGTLLSGAKQVGKINADRKAGGTGFG